MHVLPAGLIFIQFLIGTKYDLTKPGEKKKKQTQIALQMYLTHIFSVHSLLEELILSVKSVIISCKAIQKVSCRLTLDNYIAT